VVWDSRYKTHNKLLDAAQVDWQAAFGIEFDQKDTAKAKFAPNGEPASKRQKVEHVNEVLMSWQRGGIITTAQATRLAKAFQI
jgi:hypothetical protein